MVPRFRAFLIEAKTMRDVVEIDFIENMFCLQVGRATIGEWFWYRDLELMQSTGLKDKNGVEIFEGDIVKIAINNGFDYLDGNLSIVKKSEYHSGLICELLSNTLEYLITDEADTGYRYEVVGNIYENPELLEPANES